MTKDKKSDKRKTPEKTNTREKFVVWCALPEPLRDPKTQGEFASQHGVHENTLSKWRRDPKFWEEVREGVKTWNKDRLPNVMAALYKTILTKGSGVEAKLWLQWVDNWKEKTEVENPAMTEEIEKLRMSLVQMMDAVKKAK